MRSLDRDHVIADHDMELLKKEYRGAQDRDARAPPGALLESKRNSSWSSPAHDAVARRRSLRLETDLARNDGRDDELDEKEVPMPAHAPTKGGCGPDARQVEKSRSVNDIQDAQTRNQIPWSEPRLPPK